MVGSSVSRDLSQFRRWAMLVGIDYYRHNQIPNLTCSANDACALRNFLISRVEHGYGDGRVRLLVSQEEQSERIDCNTEQPPTRLNILQTLDELAGLTGRDDLLLFYFSGHGLVIDGEAYILPVDAQNTQILADTSVPLKRIKEILLAAPARAKVIILDACHLGADIRSRSAAQSDEMFIRSVFEEAEGIGILASSTQNELSWEDTQRGHGIFTFFLLEGLQGSACVRPEPFITLTDIATYVTEKVKVWSSTHFSLQRPTLENKVVGDLVLLTLDSSIVDAKTHRLLSGNFTPDLPVRQNPVRPTLTSPVPVGEAASFFGRKEPLRRIQQALAKSPSRVFMIKGGPRVGKTSLLNRIKMLSSSKTWCGRQMLSFTIEANAVTSYEKFAQELWDGVVGCLQSFSADIDVNKSSFPSQSSTIWYFSRLSALHALAPRTEFGAFIDPFDELFSQCGENEFKRITGLMRHLVEAESFPLAFFLTATQDLPHSYRSPLRMDRITLNPFEQDEFNELVMGLDDKTNGVALDWLYDYTGGHPYKAKMILAQLFDMYEEEDLRLGVDAKQLQRAAQATLDDADAKDVFEDMYSVLDDDERYTLLLLAQRSNEVGMQPLDPTSPEMKSALKRLALYSWLHPAGDGIYRLRAEYDGDWLRNWHKFDIEYRRLAATRAGFTAPALVGKEAANSAPVPLIADQGICIDLTTQRVYVDGARLEPELPYRHYQALVYLTQRVDQLVPYDDLVNHVWPEDAYQVSDSRVTTLIHRLRNALKDTQPRRRFLETVNQRGVRLKQAAFVRTPG